MREINVFETEGDFKPQARQALKQLLEKRLEEEMADYLGLSRYEHAGDRHDFKNALLSDLSHCYFAVFRRRIDTLSRSNE